MEGIIAASITGILALVGVILTNMSSNRKVEQKIEVAQAVTDTKLENLTNEVAKHNSFGTKIPVLESRVDALEKKVDNLEKK